MFFLLLKILNLLVTVSILGLVITNLEAHKNIIMGLAALAIVFSILGFIF